MSGPATRAVMRREFEVFGQRRFERLARLSNGHLYNLRRSRTYQRKRTTFTKTRPTPVAIGERRKPRPDGQPGFPDTVHQGDLDGVKGVYHINTVDEEVRAHRLRPPSPNAFSSPCSKRTSGRIPFQSGHTDNGSEYINQRVAALLNKLHIGEFTKSRARKSNDNALVEGKNAAVVSDTTTSPNASPPGSTPSPMTCYRRSSTTIDPACSPPNIKKRYRAGHRHPL